MSENFVRLRRELTYRAPRLLLALLVALGMTVFASVATQRSAHATGLPAATVGVSHKCEVVNTLSNGNQAVVCTDINMANTPTGVEVWGTGEYFCQGPSVQCKGIHANNTLTFRDLTGTLRVLQNQPFQCSTTACPNGGRAMVSTSHLGISGLCVTVTATVTTSAAILVNGTSTAFHPPTDFPVTNSTPICS